MNSNCLVGTLARWNPRTRQVSDPLEIYSNEEFYIGRDHRRCQYVIQNPFVSNKHLRIYTVLFDQDDTQDIPPLVYAQDLSLNGTLWNDYPMGRGNSSFLLSDGDILRVTVDLYLRFRSARYVQENRFSYLQRIEMREFKDHYVITPRVLGSGAYGRVHMAFKTDTGQQLACKILDMHATKAKVIEHVDEEQKSGYFPASNVPGTKEVVAMRSESCRRKSIRKKLEFYQQEALILMKLSHPNIITVDKVIRSSNTIYLFQELITAGDLFSFLNYKGGRLEDHAAAVIIHQIVIALQYLHDHNIVHRDLKPDNILMTSLADGGRVILTDFGCARLVNAPVQRMSTMVGTVEYCAPEVHQSNQRGYTKAVDLWSLGCVTAVALAGYTPFDNPSTPVPSRLANLEAEMENLNTGPHARDFLRKLLVLDESKRMDVNQALRHSWFTNPTHTREFEEKYRLVIQDWRPERTREEAIVVDLASFAHVGAGSPRSPESGSAHEPDACRRRSVDHVSESSYDELAAGDIECLPRSKVEFPLFAKCNGPSIVAGTLLNTSHKATYGRGNDGIQSRIHQASTTHGVAKITEHAIEQGRSVGGIFSDAFPSAQVSSTRRPDNSERTLYPQNRSSQFQDSFYRVAAASSPKPNLQFATLSPKLTDIRPSRRFKPYPGRNVLRNEAEGEDEVYEEVRNPVTGKRQRRIYGREMELLTELI